MVEKEQITQLLRDSKLFGSLAAEQLATITEIARLRNGPRGQRIFEQDSPCTGMYVVGSGQVKLFRTNPEGKEHLLHMARPGDTFAEAAVFGQFDYPASAEVVDDAELIFLPRGPLLRILVDHPQITLKLLAGLSVWLRRMVELMENIVLRDAAGRVAQYLLELRGDDASASVELRLKHQELAAHLGLTRETISRTFGQLESLGLIMLMPRGEIRLRDLPGLEELAGR